MSIKAIREALKRLAEHEDGSAPWTLNALAEVEAIEKAAKEWWGEESKRQFSMSATAKGTLESIARDAP